ncbi:alpha/beta fold hydrolase [Nonomuraea sp. NPDC049649]|uniref:alpha/beta fold hydrolase n=1 Tax=Nonomuraea sp. NPDC049649 TaxID=3155776 RepID=UPI003414C092
MTIRYRTVGIDGLDVFYREAGDPSAPTLVLLHGFPTSSIAHQELIGELQDEFHPIAPDYPGFGPSSAPAAFGYVPLETRLTQTAALTRAFLHGLSD